MKDIRLVIAVVDHLPRVRADTNKIVWVLSDLVSNALRYVDIGGVIRLGAELIGNYIHITVEDDGIEIPPEYQSRICQKFVRVDKQENSRPGLGLAICREIVRAHGGTIWVESDQGKGSVFTLTVPVAAKVRQGRRVPTSDAGFRLWDNGANSVLGRDFQYTGNRFKKKEKTW